MKKIFALTLLCFSVTIGVGQAKNIHYSLEAQAINTSSKYVPFWFRSNQFGSIPSSGASISLISRFQKDYDTVKKHLIGWGAAFEGRVNLGEKPEFILVEGYAKIRVGIFELKAGRSKETMGLVDTSLSSGAFSISGNALGIPKLQVSIPEFSNVLGGKLFAFKGIFAHGWIGNIAINPQSQIKFKTYQAETYFHQKSLYGRFGRPEWKLKLYGGINHQVFWGNERSFFPSSEFDLNNFKSFKYVVLGKVYSGPDGRQFSSKIGNHLGSVDLGFDYEFKRTKLFCYRQNFYDVGALAHLANILDGLNGLSLTNKRTINKTTYWKKFLVEFLYTKNQAGQLWSRFTKSGDEDYYNGFYQEGWSYKGASLGTPFISAKTATRQGLPNDSSDFFINNRVVAVHIGLEGMFRRFQYRTKLSYSWNYGTYGTSTIGHSAGNSSNTLTFYAPRYGIFKEEDQFSSFFEVERELKNMKIGVIAAFDIGGLLYNSAGLIFKISKTL